MFDSIFFNGDEYNQMWLNGNKIWEKDNGGGEEIVYPYDDADSVITYMNTGTSARSLTFDIIDSSLPYSINGTATNTFSFPASSETQVKFVNLKPRSNNSYVIPIKIEQLRIPNLTDLSYLFYYFCYKDGYEYSWSPQYFEFNENPTSMEKMFYNCKYLTDDMMDEFMPHLESFNYSNVALITQMFAYCSTLTRLDLSHIPMYMPKATDANTFIFMNMSSLETAKVPMLWMPSSNQQCLFQNCTSLKEADIMNIDTSYNTFNNNEFYQVNGATVYVGENWTLGTSSTTGGGTNNTFVKKVVPIEFIGSLNCSVNPNNVKVQYFTIKPNIVPTVYSYNDLEIIYDSTYVVLDGLFNFVLQHGSQGKTFDITYRSKTDNSISRTITITVSEDLDIPLLIDFTKGYAPSLPNWFTEETKGTRYFKYGTYNYDSTVYGLVEDVIYVSSTYTYWNCYKLIAPTTGSLEITFRANTTNSNSPFTIHATSDTTQPTQSDATNRIVNTYGTTYRDKDGVASINVVAGETYYIHFQHNRYGTSGGTGICIRSIELISLIQSINGFNYDVDLNNIEQQKFTVSPIIKPTNYITNDLEVIYDSNYMSVNPTTFEIRLRNGSQGMSYTVTYRSKTDNSINKSFTFYVNADLVLLEPLIDFTQSTAPTLPDYMIEYYSGTYKFSHGLYTTGVYGLIPSNKGRNSATAYTRYRYVAPASGDLTFTYRCSSESGYDFLTVHVDTFNSQPSYSSSTNRVLSTSGTSYADTDGTASVSVVEGTTYYIHIQYRKDSSSNVGYDMGCIRTIQLK